MCELIQQRITTNTSIDSGVSNPYFGEKRRFSQKFGPPLYNPSYLSLRSIEYRSSRLLRCKIERETPMGEKGRGPILKESSWKSINRPRSKGRKRKVEKEKEKTTLLCGRSKKARRRREDYDCGRLPRLRPPPERTPSCWPRGHEKRATVGGALE